MSARDIEQLSSWAQAQAGKDEWTDHERGLWSLIAEETRRYLDGNTEPVELAQEEVLFP